MAEPRTPGLRRGGVSSCTCSTGTAASGEPRSPRVRAVKRLGPAAGRLGMRNLALGVGLQSCPGDGMRSVNSSLWSRRAGSRVGRRHPRAILSGTLSGPLGHKGWLPCGVRPSNLKSEWFGFQEHF